MAHQQNYQQMSMQQQLLAAMKKNKKKREIASYELRYFALYLVFWHWK